MMDKRMLHVRKGKGSKERVIPVTEKGIHDIEEYLHHGRCWFLVQREKKEPVNSDHLFINTWGDPMKDFTLSIRELKKEAGIDKPVTLHTFRHSIATHLLQSGMDMEQIRRFLGHASLESTQIYTHIINEQF
jgi:integrase/recombinase XerD